MSTMMSIAVRIRLRRHLARLTLPAVAVAVLALSGCLGLGQLPLPGSSASAGGSGNPSDSVASFDVCALLPADHASQLTGRHYASAGTTATDSCVYVGDDGQMVITIEPIPGDLGWIPQRAMLSAGGHQISDMSVDGHKAWNNGAGLLVVDLGDLGYLDVVNADNDPSKFDSAGKVAEALMGVLPH